MSSARRSLRGNPKEQAGRYASRSPVCHQNDTPRQPTLYARAGMLGPTTESENRGGTHLTRKLAIVLALIASLALSASSGAGASGSKATGGSLTGAGSTFVSKLVQAWVPKVDGALGIKVTYGPIGSGGGISQITNRTVDFGASDAPLSPDQFAACKSCVQIPWALSATSIPYKAGVFALPGLKGIAAAAKTINRVAPDNGGISIVNPAKSQRLAYPICTFTYVIIPKQTSKAADLKKFVRWTLTSGQKDGPKLLFQPIPKVVLKASLKTLNLVHS